MKLRKAYIFGVEKRGQRLFENLNSAGTKIFGFIDSDASSRGHLYAERLLNPCKIQ